MMTVSHKIVPATTPNIQLAAEMLQQGNVVVFPTDTVYGVGVDAMNGAAIADLYAVKERPLDKGLPILISDIDVLPRVVASAELPHIQKLIAKHWPGPLTLILSRHPQLPENISSNDGIAVRIPDNDVARALIRAAGGAVATSSANLSTLPAATTAKESAEMLGDRVAIILDGGDSPHSVASTILDCRQSPPAVLRPGPIPEKDLLAEIAK